MQNDAKARLTLSPAAQKVLEGATTPRKRGEFVSRLLLAYSAGESGIDAIDLEGQRLQIMGLSSANRTLESRVVRLERQVSALMSRA